MRTIVIRHYRTVNNVERRIMGWGDAPPSEGWETDLLAVDANLRDKGIEFDAYYSSVLGRAKNTATYFSERHGHDAVHCSPRLNEVNYGDLAQMPKPWVTDQYPEYKTDADFVFPNGESFRQMQVRSVGFLMSLQRIHAQHTLLLVLHAGVIRALITHLLDLDFEGNLKQNVSHRYIGDFTIEDGVCVRYDEIGKPSGFVKQGLIEVPFRPGALSVAVHDGDDGFRRRSEQATVLQGGQLPPISS